MKKITLLVLISMMVMGVVSAANVNGTYKGKPIVNVVVGGKDLVVTDAPAVIMDGRTMVPISMLKQLGVQIEWDAESFSAIIAMPEVSGNPSLEKITKSVEKYDVDYVGYVSDGKGLNKITYYYNNTTEKLSNDAATFDGILQSSASTDATITEINYIDGTNFSVSTDAYRDFKEGKITAKELSDQYTMEAPNGSNTNPTPTTNNSSVSPTSAPNINTSQPTATPAPQPTNTPAPTPSNTALCENLRYNHGIALWNYSQTHDPFSGAYQWNLDILKTNQAYELVANGCS